jgi:serine/threonine protein phosphatase PrpC
MGNAESHRSTIPDEEEVSVEHIHDAVVSKHQGYRAFQEDDFDVIEFLLYEKPAQLYCVLDGHSGFTAVSHCKKHLLTNIRQCLQFEGISAIEGITSSFIKTEQDLRGVFQSSQSSSESSTPLPDTTESPKLTFRIPPSPQILINDDGSGCCSLVALKVGQSIVFANAGDCRALLIFKDKTFRNLIEEHRPTTESEIKRIHSAGLSVESHRVNGELAVSRSIGDFRYKGKFKEPDLHAVTCCPEFSLLGLEETMDKVILMTDGIYDGISMEHLVENFSTTDSLDLQIKNVVNFCLQPGKSSDNMTLLVIQL